MPMVKIHMLIMMNTLKTPNATFFFIFRVCIYSKFNLFNTRVCVAVR